MMPMKKKKKVEDGARVNVCTPQAESRPFGLRIRKSYLLLESIQGKLFPGNVQQNESQIQSKIEAASHFPCSTLRVGTWEYKSRREGDLVAKCYFGKPKLVWEILEGGFKKKIEFQWSDIVSLKAKYVDDTTGTLNVVLARRPLFFLETNPQPRKHILWQRTTDFTGGQASIHRQHFLECPLGGLRKHFEKLIQSDPRLRFLSQQGEITFDSPYFEPIFSTLDNPTENKSEPYLNREGKPSSFSLQDTTSQSRPQSSFNNDQDALVWRSGARSCENPLPRSDIRNYGLKELGEWAQINAPGLPFSMSM